MKRKLIIGMLLIGILSFGACGNEGSGDAGTQVATEAAKEEVKETKKENKQKELSMETLRSHEVSPVSDFQFRLSDGNYEIDKYLGNAEIVVVPEEYEGKKVIGVVAMAFGNDCGVKAVKLPDTVEYISNAFTKNEDLEYVICGKGLKEIGQITFAYCNSLKQVELSEGLEKIADSAFHNNASLTELYLPESLIEVGTTNFLGMSSEGFVFKCKAGTYAEEVANKYAEAYEYSVEIVE